MPDKKCVESLFNASTYHGRSNKDNKSSDEDHIADIMDIFIKTGYKITREDVYLGIERGCKIRDIEIITIQ